MVDVSPGEAGERAMGSGARDAFGEPEELESHRIRDLYRREKASLAGQFPGISVVELDDGRVQLDHRQVERETDESDLAESATRLNRWRAILRSRGEDV